MRTWDLLEAYHKAAMGLASDSQSIIFFAAKPAGEAVPLDGFVRVAP